MKAPTIRELAAKHKLEVKETDDTIDQITGKLIYLDEIKSTPQEDTNNNYGNIIVD